MGGGRRQRARNENTFLESVAGRQDHLEVLLADLHWTTVGQWRQAAWEKMPMEVSQCLGDDHQGFGFSAASGLDIAEDCRQVSAAGAEAFAPAGADAIEGATEEAIEEEFDGADRPDAADI